MSLQLIRKGLAFATIAIALMASAAHASHNRGSVLIPSIDSQGVLTVDATSFWRNGAVSGITSVTITRPDATTLNLNTSQVGSNDTSDIRYSRRDDTVSSNTALTTPGLYKIGWSSCCRVGGILNANQSTESTESTIYWNGNNATKPITFNIETIQPNVERGNAYTDNLGATSDNGDTLTFDDTLLTQNITSQAPGFTIDGTGQINIPAAKTSDYIDNPTANIGADVAFSAQINASDGNRTTGSVQFDWLFDGVAPCDPNTTVCANAPPSVSSVVIAATIGDYINTDVTGSDPDGADNVVLSLTSFTGPGGAVLGGMFLAGAPDNPVNGNFQWDSSGFVAGIYTASILGSDGFLSDTGTITINLSKAGGPPPNVPAVPLPASMWLLGGAVAGIGALRRRRGKK